MMPSSVRATGFLLSLVQAVAIFRLSFCNTLSEHFFCGVRPVLDLACVTPIISDILTLVINLLVISVPATFLLTSCVLLISTILKTDSAENQKTFATCTSHLTMAVPPLLTARVSGLKTTDYSGAFLSRVDSTAFLIRYGPHGCKSFHDSEPVTTTLRIA
uniref:Uncharacterized protein n=1 Tax=Molossus molossus TaxID=27622 RepID=A0A7J8CRN6_MOLMO|nr:hypothetical protein HJG59_009778 [Molossus molossus]